MRNLPLLAALLLLLPVAGAQGPAPTYCGPISIGTAQAPTLAPGGIGEITVPVSYTNQVSAAVVTVGASTTTPGWTVLPDSPPQTQTLGGPNGPASGSFKVRVQASDTATQPGAVSLVANAACNAPPAPLSCPNNACVASATGSATVQLQQGEGFGIPGLDDLSFPIEYLVAGVVLVAVAVAIPLMIRKRKPGLAADCPEPLKMVRPGRGTSFPIDIRNPGAEALTATFEVGPVPEGWSAFMPLPEVQLAPREARSLWLMVRAPATAASGETADVEVRLRDAARADNSATVKVRAEVNPNAAEGAAKPA